MRNTQAFLHFIYALVIAEIKKIELIKHKNQQRNSNFYTKLIIPRKNNERTRGRAGLTVSAVDCCNYDQGSFPRLGNLYSRLPQLKPSSSLKRVSLMLKSGLIWRLKKAARCSINYFKNYFKNINFNYVYS